MFLRQSSLELVDEELPFCTSQAEIKAVSGTWHLYEGQIQRECAAHSQGEKEGHLMKDLGFGKV